VLTDSQIADVLTYVLNSWGNKGDAISADQVKAIRNEAH
jgi:mono/diheme cytochrome c family protein